MPNGFAAPNDFLIFEAPVCVRLASTGLLALAFALARILKYNPPHGIPPYPEAPFLPPHLHISTKAQNAQQHIPQRVPSPETLEQQHQKQKQSRKKFPTSSSWSWLPLAEVKAAHIQCCLEHGKPYDFFCTEYRVPVCYPCLHSPAHQHSQTGVPDKTVLLTTATKEMQETALTKVKRLEVKQGSIFKRLVQH
ncbi:hypothetical protein Pelo_4894 [Pelomyxa schiedti]|nr:hypothetical protein Pelo_4894 [Pelomyxa schiedti]